MRQSALEFEKGAVGAYLGCCRGCGAHLIWVTSIDAFSPKKSLLAREKLNYFTVLHKGSDLRAICSILGTFLHGFERNRREFSQIGIGSPTAPKKDIAILVTVLEHERTPFCAFESTRHSSLLSS